MSMGYFYWCVALGNLFGGLLSGITYARFGPAARDGVALGGTDQPGAMWLIFAGLALLAAVLLWIYDRWLECNPAAGDPARGI
ncbi:MAG: hypothetical protein R3D98_00430 [Candidatus Krumholzibacteriia bacterium]